MNVQQTALPLAERSTREATLRAKADELEAAFLTEMLAHSGFGRARESFGGGIGEEQFASFLRTEQAEGMVESGGIGLSEHLFRALMGKDDTHA
jgi:peptidoglycan hydrolase FlgJ